MDGLRDDIRAVIVVQGPQNLDTAYTLALLQEEVADSARRKESKRDSAFYARPPFKQALPLPAPTPADKKPKAADAAAVTMFHTSA